MKTKIPPLTVKLNDKLSGAIEDMGSHLALTVGCQSFSYESVQKVLAAMQEYRQRIVYYAKINSTSVSENYQGDGI